MNNTVQFQSIAVSDGMQPALIYIRTPLVGTDLQYTLAGLCYSFRSFLELGWINSSVVFRLSLLPQSTLPALPPKRERAPVPPAPIATSSPAAVSFSSADFSLAQSAELPVRLENIKNGGGHPARQARRCWLPRDAGSSRQDRRQHRIPAGADSHTDR